MSEIKDVRQIENEGRRRWFRDEELDLIIWYRQDDSVDGFQLCYGKSTGEHALTWHHPNRYEHHSIDDGERVIGGPKMSPVLVADGVFDSNRVAELFTERSRGLPRDIVELVRNVLARYGTSD